MRARDDQARPAPGTSASLDVLAVEREVLRALCCDAASAQLPHARLLDTGLAGLSGYRFRSLEHQMVFGALLDLRPTLDGAGGESARGDLQEHLLRRLTLLGFPDVDLGAYFEPHTFSASEVLEQMNTLARFSAT